MMQPLHIDFGASRQRSPWIGRVMLAVSALVALDAGLSYHAARQTLNENQARLAQRTPARNAPKVSPQEVAAARETVQRLTLPWDELFAAIEPDPRNGTVTISGDGKDYLAALSYVLNLSHTEGLDRVQMVRHEQKNEGVSFAVSAAWSAR